MSRVGRNGKSPGCTKLVLDGENEKQLLMGAHQGLHHGNSQEILTQVGAPIAVLGNKQSSRSEPPGRLPPCLLVRSAGGATRASAALPYPARPSSSRLKLVHAPLGRAALHGPTRSPPHARPPPSRHSRS